MTSAVRVGASLLSIDRKLNTPLGSPAYNMSKVSFLINSYNDRESYLGEDFAQERQRSWANFRSLVDNCVTTNDSTCNSPDTKEDRSVPWRNTQTNTW